jgi:hypothetical protein
MTWYRHMNLWVYTTQTVKWPDKNLFSDLSKCQWGGGFSTVKNISELNVFAKSEKDMIGMFSDWYVWKPVLLKFLEVVHVSRRHRTEEKVRRSRRGKWWWERRKSSSDKRPTRWRGQEDGDPHVVGLKLYRSSPMYVYTHVTCVVQSIEPVHRWERCDKYEKQCLVQTHVGPPVTDRYRTLCVL